jgi:hypothetical protein
MNFEGEQNRLNVIFQSASFALAWHLPSWPEELTFRLDAIGDEIGYGLDTDEVAHVRMDYQPI